MKATKYINSKGLPKGAFIYKIKKDGTKSARPTFHLRTFMRPIWN